MLELLFLLIPVVAGYSYYMGKNSERQNKQSANESLSIKYSTGINYLLSNQNDKAIEHLLETLAVEDDTVEAHFAMANLFRKRGELDRALKVHEHLVRQKHLASKQKQQAIYELGKDFYSAGLYDRAEDLFSRINKTKDYSVRALHFLLQIFQQTKDWDKGIALKKLIVKSKDKQLLHTLANFYCEQANLALAQQDFIAVFELLEQALAVYPGSSRASALMAQVYESNKQFEQAIRCYQDIYQKDRAFFPDVINKMQACYQALGTESEFQQFIKSVYEQTGSTSALIKYLTLLAASDGNEAANAYMLVALKKRPTIRGFNYFVEMQKSNSEDVKASLDAIKELISTYINIRPRYRCGSCGFNSSVHYWSCPSCHAWEQIKPVHGLEGE